MPPANQPSETTLPGDGHLLSFDVEEYFQVESAARGGVGPEQWDSYPLRLDRCIDGILQLLAEHNAKATFFVLGWVARREGPIVRRIASQGHEIASHGMSHRMLHHLQPAEFLQELHDSRRILQDLTSQPVWGFRAPTFSITTRTLWALDCLAQAGYRYDSSIFPVRHDRYGIPDAPRFAHLAKGPAGGEILEIPPLTLRLLGQNLPVGGGGYLRLLPVHILGLALRSAQRANHYGMIYLHPWEFDPLQPSLPMSFASRLRHRVNLHRTHKKLRWLLERFSFSSTRPLHEQMPGR